MSNKKPKVIGLLRVRNEKMLIKEQVEHFASFCDQIYAYDDGSTDGTLEVLQDHPDVDGVFANPGAQPSKFPRRDKTRIAWKMTRLFNFARKKSKATEKDWFAYADVDEKFEQKLIQAIPEIVSQNKYDAVLCECYEFYLTDQDQDISYNGDIESIRKYCGTEYRILPFLFRNISKVFFATTAREPFGFDPERIWHSSFKTKHYGKAKGIDDYNQKQKWYQKYRKAEMNTKYKYTQSPIHKVSEGKSDLGELITWEYLQKHSEIKGPIFYQYTLMPWGWANKNNFTYELAKIILRLKGLIGKILFYKYWKKFLKH